MAWLCLFGGLLSGCGNPDKSNTSTEAGPAEAEKAAASYEKTLRLALAKAQPGDVIEVAAGTWPMTRSLTLNVDGVTLRGAGMGKSVLSFKNQIAGAEGLLVNASDFTLEDLAIEDTKGDALKVNEGSNIVIRRVRTEWTGGPSVQNGSYGIYPVQTENTLIEDSVAMGASDAGIYVGQSRNVVVRNNRAEYNVAGIEIENCIGADVYDNLATHNTGGILVFNMPDLPQPGHATRIFRNRVDSNNTDNFAPEGTAVASVPAGSGVVINSNDQVEIFDNRISDNRTANVLITSYFSAGYSSRLKTQENFDPYPEQIYIYANSFSGGGDAPDDLRLKALRLAQFGLNGHFPDVVWDGIVNPEKSEGGRLKPEFGICIDNGDAGIINLDMGNDNANISTEMDSHRCEIRKLPEIQLPEKLLAQN